MTLVSLLEMSKPVAGMAFFVVCMYIMAQQAYHIRMYAIHTYGYVIHEFDPWFNYRATEYLADRGWHACAAARPVIPVSIVVLGPPLPYHT